jgi:hypothetical protein
MASQIIDTLSLEQCRLIYTPVLAQIWCQSCALAIPEHLGRLTAGDIVGVATSLPGSQTASFSWQHKPMVAQLHNRAVTTLDAHKTV